MSTILRTLAAAAMLATSQASAATGDWPQYGFSAQGRRENTQERILNRKTVPHLVRKWSTNLQLSPSTAAAVANGIVYLGGRTPLFALDAGTGAPVWNAPIAWGVTSPAVADGVVYVGTGDGKIDAFDAETGAIRWTAQPGPYSVATPVAVAHGLVYAGTDDGHALAIDARTGVLKWASSVPPYSNGALSSPSVADGIVYFSLEGSGPALLIAFDATSGVLLWTQEIDATQFASAPAAYMGTVFVSDGWWLWAFDAKTGQKRWNSAEGDARNSAIAFAGEHIYLLDSQGALDNYDAATGEMVNRTKTGQPVYLPTPAVANGVIYTNAIGPNSRSLSAYNSSTGKLLWQQQSTGSSFGVPTVANGMLYAGSGNQFIAYGLP
jgi:eukaryotic-like serine/threonine-protein kinase